MKNINRKILSFLLIGVLTLSTVVTIVADDDLPAEKVTGITCSQSKITVGEKFELKALLEPYDAEDDNVKWKIVGKKGIVKFEDYDRYGDEAEFIAQKAGTTKIRCRIVGKGKSYSKAIKITVKASNNNKIKRKGLKNVTVEAYDDFDLEVTGGSNVKNSDLEWTIKNTSIIGFDTDVDYDDTEFEKEFYAKKSGKTTITCTNTKTGKAVKFKVNVVVGYDD